MFFLVFFGLYQFDVSIYNQYDDEVVFDFCNPPMIFSIFFNKEDPFVISMTCILNIIDVLIFSFFMLNRTRAQEWKERQSGKIMTTMTTNNKATQLRNPCRIAAR